MESTRIYLYIYHDNIDASFEVLNLPNYQLLGIVYVFRVRRHCWAEDSGIREQNVRVNTKSALGLERSHWINEQIRCSNVQRRQ